MLKLFQNIFTNKQFYLTTGKKLYRFGLLLFVIAFDTNNIYGQDIFSINFCKHYEGKVCNNAVSYDLIKIDNNLIAKTFDIEGVHEFLSGKMLDSSQFYLWEDNYGKYYGKFAKDGTVTGMWEAYNKKVSCSVELKESYFMGTMPFYISHTKDSMRSGTNCPMLHYDLTLCTPDNYPNLAVSDSVNRHIVLRFFNIAAAQNMKADNYMYLYLMDFQFPAYYNTICQSASILHNHEKLFFTKMVIPVLNENFILCLAYYDETNVSSSPIDNKTFYEVFNLKTGKLLSLNDIFINDYSSVLKKRINEKLRNQLLLPDQFDMKEAGFTCPELALPNNFYVNGSGIGFVYNSEDIGNYMLGNIDLFFYFNEISDIIDKKSIIQILMNK
jgi:hypothetical protein